MLQRWEPLLAWARRVSLDFQRNRTSLAAGGLAYFVALSIAPAALAFGTFAGLVLDPEEVRSALERIVGHGPGTIDGAQGSVDSLVNLVEGASSSTLTVTTLVSVLIAVYASSKVVLGLRMAMNTTFGTIETRSGLIERGISTVVTLVGLILGVALVIAITVIPRILQAMGIDDFHLSTGSWLLDWLVVVVLVWLAVRWVMHHAPNGGHRVPWLSPGVAVATIGIVGATIGVGIYTRFSASLGATILLFGTAVVVMLWLYLCFLALLWGAIIEADRQGVRSAPDGVASGND